MRGIGSETKHAITAVCGLVLVMSCFSLAVVSIARPAHTVTATRSVAVEETAATRPVRVVLDAGHGGEDGGAVGKNGISEKNLNLSIVLTLGDMLEAAGVSVAYTRTEDCGLYEGAIPGHRKMTDLKNRLAVRNRYPDAMFVSVHMNTFSAPQYRGMQVFYSKNSEDSRALAETVRLTCKTYLQPDNDRQIKAADSAIYLLDRSAGCAILAECGFLSNPEEAASLADPAYRETVAAILCASILQQESEKGVYQ